MILNFLAEEEKPTVDPSEAVKPTEIKPAGSADKLEFFLPTGNTEKHSIFWAAQQLFEGLGDALKPIIQTALEWSHQLQIPNIFH
ncbi:hypothetical protein L1O03_08585 [Corynebacterium uropygiale]|uniref:Uncharacterized protein n=1 Tax=Corynebacterium uropygiale TaxID=1775911 RepID=A0A9X1QTG5_9CORY|nr:hypothetical protein [Corynebacterium uropygiale]MCF4007229.1 hypothetical protein [Corynebacterium uropygiale]